MQPFMEVSNKEEYEQFRIDYKALTPEEQEGIFDQMAAFLEKLKDDEAHLREFLTPRQVETTLRNHRRKPRRRLRN